MYLFSLQNSEVFLDIRSMPRIRKKVKKFALQQECESRIVWKNVTEALQREDAEAAADAKHQVSLFIVDLQNNEALAQLLKSGPTYVHRITQ